MKEASPLKDGRLKLRDGRTLAYAEYGKPAGQPVLLLNGSPGSRLLHPDAIMAGSANTRIITLDRPGYGQSDTISHGRMLDRVDEAAELADVLGIERFAVIGVSSGGPHAAACAWRLPERVTALGVVSSPAPLPLALPMDSDGLERYEELDEETKATRALSWNEFFAWFKEHNGSTPPDVEQFLAFILDTVPECDRRAKELPEVYAFLRITFAEAFRQGMVGWAWDTWTLGRPWGFSVGDIHVPTYLWHGLDDEVVPIRHARALAQLIPNCAATYYPDTGHFVPPYRWNEILTTMVTVPDTVH
jgi:pimeloyl-ACP methyl ester carboxylesterase